MKSLKLLMAFICLCFAARGQVINRAEYFFDVDPGIGNALSLIVSPQSDTVIISKNISTAGLNTGYHTLFIRVMDATNNWSIYDKHGFYILPPLYTVANIVETEYFFDLDPGVGLGNSIAVPVLGDTVTISKTIATSGLLPGIHRLFIRVRDSSNVWSLYDRHIFLILNNLPAVPTITSAEYFTDIDPGVGNGKPISIITSDTIIKAFSFDTTGLAKGFHTVYVRVKNSQGVWSLYDKHTFFINSNLPSASAISNAEYFFNNDPGVGNGFPLSVATNDTIIYSGLIPPNDTLFGFDTLYMRVRNTDSVWSLYQGLSYNVCTVRGPIADYHFVKQGLDAYFFDDSQNEQIRHWDFGDGDTANIQNPYHHYDLPGVYNACLKVSNVCGIDSICKQITVIGINAIETNHGGNTGAVSVVVKGAGFSPGLQLWLQKSGEANIYGDTLIIQNEGLLSTGFDLTGKTIGVWDVVCVYANGDTSKILNGFTIEQGTSDSLWVSITGPPVLRIGFNQIYTITYGNAGNQDAVLVPVFISGLPPKTNIEIIDKLYPVDSIPGFDTLTVVPLGLLNRTIYDSLTNTCSRLFYLRKIAAGTNGTINLIFHIYDTLNLLHTRPLVQVIIHQPLYSSVEGLYRSNYHDIAECAESAITLAANVLSTGLNFSSCYLGIAATVESAFFYYVSDKDDRKVLDGVELAWSATSTVINCAKSLLGVVFPEIAIIESIYEATAFMMEIGKPTFETVAKCSKAFTKEKENYLQLEIIKAGDPNLKYGPGGASYGHYLTNNQPLSYVLNFENDTNSNALVQTIKVIDTLDANAFDYSTFGFTGVTLGESVYSLPAPATSFVHDFNFRQLYGVDARVVGIFDNVTGIAKWTIYTIDTLTEQITTNAIAGFLPPDTASPKGQGNVSFIINPNPAIQSTDTINNSASIIFDFNAPIITNNWQNIFDLVKPISTVNSLATVQIDSVFTVSWTGADVGSGIAGYDIYYSVNNGPYFIWLANTSKTDSMFTGNIDSTYCFYSIALDSAGNYENAKLINDPNACTSVSVGLQSLIAPELLLRVYPNPTFGEFTLSFKLKEPERCSLKITDLLGRCIICEKLDANVGFNKSTFDLSETPAGIYIVELQFSDGKVARKLVKN